MLQAPAYPHPGNQVPMSIILHNYTGTEVHGWESRNEHNPSTNDPRKKILRLHYYSHSHMKMI